MKKNKTVKTKKKTEVHVAFYGYKKEVSDHSKRSPGAPCGRSGGRSIVVTSQSALRILGPVRA